MILRAMILVDEFPARRLVEFPDVPRGHHGVGAIITDDVPGFHGLHRVSFRLWDQR